MVIVKRYWSEHVNMCYKIGKLLSLLLFSWRAVLNFFQARFLYLLIFSSLPKILPKNYWICAPKKLKVAPQWTTLPQKSVNVAFNNSFCDFLLLL